jgi:hypothetical protein
MPHLTTPDHTTYPIPPPKSNQIKITQSPIPRPVSPPHHPSRGLECAASSCSDSGLPSQWPPIMQPGILRKASKSYLTLSGQQAQNLPASWKTGAALW